MIALFVNVTTGDICGSRVASSAMAAASSVTLVAGNRNALGCTTSHEITHVSIHGKVGRNAPERTLNAGSAHPTCKRERGSISSVFAHFLKTHTHTHTHTLASERTRETFQLRVRQLRQHVDQASRVERLRFFQTAELSRLAPPPTWFVRKVAGVPLVPAI